MSVQSNLRHVSFNLIYFDKMKKLFSYQHEVEQRASWNSRVYRDKKSGKYYHCSSLGEVAIRAFQFLNSEFNSKDDESLSFPSANKAFKYFLK